MDDREANAQETTAGDLETAVLDRVADAEALLAAGRFASAVAMGLYALEIRLKINICRNLDEEVLPRLMKIHDLHGLLLFTRLKRRLFEGKARKGVLKRNWDKIVKFRSNEGKLDLNILRYKSGHGLTGPQVAEFLGWLNHPTQGVLTWLSKQL